MWREKETTTLVGRAKGFLEGTGKARFAEEAGQTGVRRFGKRSDHGARDIGEWRLGEAEAEGVEEIASMPGLAFRGRTSIFRVS
jgi:hypothetical protein